ncbi:MAG: CAP domain-containing protein [Anaerolineales bacterium]|nr:CAP domain-containing protein [Anaerolineales bacterium]
MPSKWNNALWKLTASVALALSFFVLNWSLLPTARLVAQAAPAQPPSAAVIRASAVATVYLPLVVKAPYPEEDLRLLINAERTSRGLAPLAFDALLAQAAEAHSQDMINRNFFSHINPDGLDPGDRVANAGYSASTVGETIGAGYTTPAAMLTGWLNSPGHRDILLSPNFTEIGLGYVTGGTYGHYWTAVFARPN